MNCAPKLGRVKSLPLGSFSKGLVPEFHRGQALQLLLTPDVVPVVDVRLKVALEPLEVLPVPPAEELVIDVPEDLLGGAVVDAVAPCATCSG